MLNHLLDQMDEYLSNKPFKHHWWSRPWIAHMTIQPPLSKECPLWKRSQDELRLLRLFDLSPEELRLKIERYWKKPRWRRWFASFGMNKKIDVWNYYQRCLAYQVVRSSKLEQESFFLASQSRQLLNKLGFFLHQSNVKFETYLEKRCRNLKWIEKHFWKEIKAYQQQLQKAFLTKLNKSLKKTELKVDRFALKQQAEQEYQQVEALMLRYFELQLNNFFSRPSQPNLVPELGPDIAQDGNMTNAERSIAVYQDTQSVSFLSPSALPIEVNHQIVLTSLRGTKEWIQSQRERLKLLLEEGSLQKVEALLQTSLDEIKEITEFYLGSCETRMYHIQGKHEAYDGFSKHLNKLQCRLKALLQGGMLLFHPDHAMSLTHSQVMWALLTRYSQSYLEQSRCYLDRFKNCHLRLEALYQHSQQELQRQQSLGDWSDLAHSIQELGESLKDLEESLIELDKKLTKDTKEFWDKMYAKLKQDKVEMRAELEQEKAEMYEKLEQYKAESDAKFKEAEAEIYVYLKAKHEISKTSQNVDDTHVNEQVTSISDSAEKLINRSSF